MLTPCFNYLDSNFWHVATFPFSRVLYVDVLKGCRFSASLHLYSP